MMALQIIGEANMLSLTRKRMIADVTQPSATMNAANETISYMIKMSADIYVLGEHGCTIATIHHKIESYKERQT